FLTHLKKSILQPSTRAHRGAKETAMEDGVNLQVWTNQEFLARIDAVALEEHRSRASLARVLLEEALAARGEWTGGVKRVSTRLDRGVAHQFDRYARAGNFSDASAARKLLKFALRAETTSVDDDAKDVDQDQASVVA